MHTTTISPNSHGLSLSSSFASLSIFFGSWIIYHSTINMAIQEEHTKILSPNWTQYIQFHYDYEITNYKSSINEGIRKENTNNIRVDISKQKRGIQKPRWTIPTWAAILFFFLLSLNLFLLLIMCDSVDSCCFLCVIWFAAIVRISSDFAFKIIK